MRISDWSSDVCSSDLRCVVESYPDERKYEREDGAMAGEDAQRDNGVTTGAVMKVTDSPVGPTVGAMPVRGRAAGGRAIAPGRIASAEATADAVADLAGAAFAEAPLDLTRRSDARRVGSGWCRRGRSRVA